MAENRFFEVALPNMAARSFGDFLQVQGAIAFDIAGEEQWTFTFGSQEPVAKGLNPKADLTLRFTRDAFDAFVEGTLDTVAAVKAREVVLLGGNDFSLLE